MYLGEDSFFLSDELSSYLRKKDRKIKILDMGTNSGIQAETCVSLGFKNILAVDIDSEAISNLKNKKISAIKSDLFNKIKKSDKFDLIIFNPPYLPEDKFDKEKDTSGGKNGDETILEFLKKARAHLTEKGEILLLLSSFTPKERIERVISKEYEKTQIAERKLFFEILFIWKLSLQAP